MALRETTNMECNWSLSTSILIAAAAAALVLLALGWWNKAKKNGGAARRQPPGPTGWPVVGNMFDLGTMPHQNMYKLRFIYGPVLWLRLGSVNTMVIQSAKAASEFFQKHDLNFSDRKVPDVLTVHGYSEGSMAIGRYGKYWRVIRKVCSMEFLSSKRMEQSAILRRKCVENLTRWIEEDAMDLRSKGGLGDVEICNFLFLVTFNIVGNLMLSNDLLEPQSLKANSFYNGMDKVIRWVGMPNVSDLFPILKPFDVLGIRRNMVRDMGLCLDIVDGFIRERIQEKESGKQAAQKDFLDTLLEYEGDGKEWSGKLPESKIKIIVLEMFFAGAETTSSTIEWSLTELLRSPETMVKAKEEIDRVIGPHEKVEEADIDRLPYLQAVMKETLRLHPAIPLLLPRNAMKEANYLGYHIPKSTQVYVNAWAIGRDPEAWNDPLSFSPERFLDKNIEYKGQNFELIPFGAGRRVCVGYPLGHRVAHYVLATLLQSFDWELSDQVTPETMDMNERFGITLPKLVPLKVIPTKRKIPKSLGTV